MQLTLNDRKYPTQSIKRSFIHRLDDRLTAINALSGSTTASYIPLNGGWSFSLTIDGQSDPANLPPVVTIINVGRRYFETLGLRVVRGRTFTDDDNGAGHEGAIVN